MALADQVLELPQNSAESTSSPPASIASPDETAPPHKPRHRAMAPVPQNLGTLQDYERENGEDASGAPLNSANSANFANFAGAPSNPATPLFEIGGNNHQTVAQNAILGVLMLGLFAMEVQSAHHHHH
jgi:hypothetical protein